MADLSELQDSLGVRPKAKKNKSISRAKKRPWTLSFDEDVNDESDTTSKKVIEEPHDRSVRPKKTKFKKRKETIEEGSASQELPRKKNDSFKEGECLPPEKIVNKVKNMMLFLCAVLDGDKTEKLTYTEMSMYLGVSKEAARSYCRYLLKFNSISVYKHYSGANGGVIFQINEKVKKYFFDNYEKDIKFFAETKKNYVTSPGEKRKAVEFNPAQDTYQDNNHSNLPGDWQKIDISCLPGFTANHLRSIYASNLNADRAYPVTPELVQESLHNMAFDIKYNSDILAERFNKGPINVVVGALVKGNAYNSVTPDTYVSPEVEKLQSFLKMKADEKKKKDEALSGILEVEFEEWFEQLSEEEKNDFADEEEFKSLPPKVKLVRIRESSKEIAREYFEINKWPEKQAEILAELGIES